MNDPQLIHHSKTWDRTGVFVASLCLLHCLAFPFFIAALPATRAFFANAWLEGTILVLGIIVGSISFYTSYKKHRKIYPTLLGLLGVIFLFSNLFLFPGSYGHAHDSSFIQHIDPLMILGGSFLIAGHLWNIHACHCFCDTSCDHEEHDPNAHHDHTHQH